MSRSEMTKIDPQVWRIAAVVFLGPFMSQMDSTIVNVSLAIIREDLHASLTAAHWIIGAYLLALALLLPLSGWLVDRVGAKRLYLVCFSAFTMASLLCGAARSVETLILARILQGAAGGLLAPMTQMMIARVAGRHMARVMGFAAIPVLFAPILGPSIAGLILKFASWPWLFYVNLPVGISAVFLAARILPSDDQVVGTPRPFDFLGFLLLSPALAALLYGLEVAAHKQGVWIFGTGAVLALLFAWHALRQPRSALIDLRLFRERTFSAAAITQFLANGQALGGQFLLPLFLITGCGMSAAEAGGMIAPIGLGMLCSFPLMGPLTERWGYRAVATTGALLALAGTLPFVWMTEHPFSRALALAALFVRGVGQGAIGIPSMAAAYGSIPQHRLPLATTAINIVQRLGGPFITTLTAILVSLVVPQDAILPAHAFFVPAFFLSGIHVLACVSANWLPSKAMALRVEDAHSTALMD